VVAVGVVEELGDEAGRADGVVDGEDVDEVGPGELGLGAGEGLGEGVAGAALGGAEAGPACGESLAEEVEEVFAVEREEFGV